MVSKNISIRLDLYKKLKKLKEKDESFSDVIERLLNEGLLGGTSRIMKHFGSWSDLPNKYESIIKTFRTSIDENIESRMKENLDDIS
ncbi:MAG: antitoxin [Promethearchaeota archaeon]|nr:MAG: antitoxin [Candidatus Lokiarchaeota archaeon]